MDTIEKSQNKNENLPNLKTFYCLFAFTTTLFYIDIVTDCLMLKTFYSSHFYLFCLALFFTVLPIVCYFIYGLTEVDWREHSSLLCVFWKFFKVMIQSVINYNLWK